ncbi:hypothetical protein [Glycomyces sp. NPDC047010]|uniref:hypothetical protein n=1 Tax=Glycomyces sp. NPDC047010 TaxID=3155023 RepID=UPI003403B8E5
MPGSAILAVVFLGLAALLSIPTGIALLAEIPWLSALLFAGAALAAVIAVGVSLRRRWARIGGAVWAGTLAGFFLIEAMRVVNSVTPNSSYSTLFAFWLVLMLFLLQRNTRLWCDGGKSQPAPTRPRADPPRVGPIPRQARGLAVGDEVELVDDVARLRAGTIVVIVELPDPEVVVAEYPHPETGVPTEVVLRRGEIRVSGGAD